MASLIFPQMSSGALVQYPIRKTNGIRTIKNILADGSMLVAADPGAGQLVWTLSYIALQPTDMNALQAHFEACAGPLRAFTFLDPTDNLLTYSADLTQPPWITPATVNIQSGMPDPIGGTGAFYVANAGSATQQIFQTLPAAPVNFQYCFSVYASSATGGMCRLERSSANAQETTICRIGPQWSRISSSGLLNDNGVGLSVGISLPAGQSVSPFWSATRATVCAVAFPSHLFEWWRLPQCALGRIGAYFYRRRSKPVFNVFQYRNKRLDLTNVNHKPDQATS